MSDTADFYRRMIAEWQEKLAQIPADDAEQRAFIEGEIANYQTMLKSEDPTAAENGG